MLRTSILFFLLVFACVAVLRAQDSSPVSTKGVEDLIVDLTGEDRDAADAARYELGKRGKAAIPALIVLAQDGKRENRVRSISVLGLLKEETARPLLIELLNDKDDWIRGNAAWSLSQMGGEDAKIALVQYLGKCVEQDTRELNRATEALSELPDERAVPFLLKIIDKKSKTFDGPSYLEYPVAALGKLKTSAAAVPIAKLLDPSVSYDNSRDYFYLQALIAINSSESAPYLVRYLIGLEKRLKSNEWFLGEDDSSYYSSIGAGNRQRESDRHNFGLAVKCLESITGIKSSGKTPVEILHFWKENPDISPTSP